MAFEEAKEQLKDKWQEFKTQLDDSAAFNTLKERFETLNPNMQKGIIWSGIIVFSLMMMSCPYSYWSTSSDYVAEYDSTRDMIRELLKSSHMVNQIGNTQAPLSDAQVRSQINRVIVGAQLLPDQNQAIEKVDANQFGRSLAPKSIQQEGWVVQLAQLNTKQIVEVGHRLQNMHEGIKLAGMDLSVFPKDPRYYNAQFRLVKFLTTDPTANKEDDKADNNNKKRGQ